MLENAGADFVVRVRLMWSVDYLVVAVNFATRCRVGRWRYNAEYPHLGVM